MDLRQLFKKRIQKIEMLNEFIAVYCCKQEAINDIQQLQRDTQKVKELLAAAAKILDEFTLTNRNKYNEIIEQMHKQQMAFLELLQIEMDKEPIQKIAKPIKEAEENANESVLKEISNTTMTPNRFRLNEPARMSLVDYLKSPFTSKRIKPVALHFFDFERIISVDEFTAVPSYMKGRENLEDIQQFLDAVIIGSFTFKYALLPKRREAVPPNELHLWNLYKSQEEYFKGYKFITQGDICQLTEKQIDKKTTNRITVLRHLKIIREERKNSAICYIWVKENTMQRR